MFQLIYQGQYQQAVKFSEHVWKPINESTELMGFAAYDFINVIYLNNLQKYYEAVLNNTPFNTSILFDKNVEMGLVKTSIKEKKDNHLLHLNIQFLKYMHQQFNFSFIFSEQLWRFIATLKIFGKHGKENWFYIDAKTMDKHIIENYDSLLASSELQIFGKVWGFDYIISFF